MKNRFKNIPVFKMVRICKMLISKECENIQSITFKGYVQCADVMIQKISVLM